MDFFIGGYGSTIQLARLNTQNGKLLLIGAAAELARASFLIYSHQFRALYACGETGDESESGEVARFRVTPEGELTPAGLVSSCGGDPCHIAVDSARSLAIVTNYTGGTVGLLELGADGELPENVSCIAHRGKSIHPSRQTRPHPHAAVISPDGRFAYVCDLGTDEIVRYLLPSRKGAVLEELGRVSVEAGSGPRHLEFSPDGQAYLVNELSNTVVVLEYTAESGNLSRIQQLSTLPGRYQGDSTTAEIVIHPSGRFVYASNRGADSVVVFGRDARTGRLESSVWFDVQGATPRHFAIDPTGRWCVVALQDSNEVRSFLLDARSGLGSPTGSVISSPKPSCITLLPERKTTGD